MADLRVDPDRKGRFDTGIPIRASNDGRFISCDIGDLTAASLLEWLRSRGGENRFAENVVGILLGHPVPLVQQEEEAEAQRRSFAYGNAAIDNPGVTRELVDQVAEEMKQAEEARGA